MMQYDDHLQPGGEGLYIMVAIPPQILFSASSVRQTRPVTCSFQTHVIHFFCILSQAMENNTDTHVANCRPNSMQFFQRVL